MTIQSVSLAQLTPSKANPRKLFEVSALEGLAASIRADGLLQNLVVAPAKGRTFSIISGERRYRALKLLEERGQLPEGFTVPVEIRTATSKDERVRLATVENLQRADLTPLEQTAALTKLVKDGENLEELAAQTGLSLTTIRRRLALNTMCKEAKAALEAGTLSLAQAEALTLGDRDVQRRIVEDVGRGSFISPDLIRRNMIGRRPCVADAVFPLEQYTGSLTTDLFAEGETSYFDDVEQFIALQKEAVAELAAQYAKTAPWVEVTEDWNITDWQYEDAPEGERGGVLINITPRGIVEVREGLLKPDIDEGTADTLAENPLAPPKAKPFYTAPLRRIIGHCKTAAVGELLLASPRTAKEVLAVLLLDAFNLHEAYREAAKHAERQKPFTVLDQQARMMAQRLGLPVEEGECGWAALASRTPFDPVALYTAIKALSDHDLDELHTLIVALTFGQKYCDRLECGDTLFNRVAQDLKADLRNHWTPDRAFLSRRTREQLLEIAKENGMAEGRGALATYKKTELVEGILFHDAQARSASSPTQAQRKALDWLPEAFLFPATGPDTHTQAEGPDADALDAEADDEADDHADEGEGIEADPLEEESLREAA
ncbi:MAG: ParB/RepB/Spo0J family partition protein [Alphaproteobacteria bacterium]|nr:ParB/RepB/Spo0J family partition protein [Alphaproteobacteria bacterium]MBP7904485.1 ParB/RepB/Spo0J family partition protein [Alphaproteobacteria bacterium]